MTGRPDPVEWDGELGGLGALSHGAPLTARGRLLAGSRDASMVKRPDVYTLKARHVAVASHRTAIGSGQNGVAAACDPVRLILVEDQLADIDKVHPNGRCRRRGCRELFAKHVSPETEEGAR
jgi:hypothetical protein